jgi:hypothetical protein
MWPARVVAAEATAEAEARGSARKKGANKLGGKQWSRPGREQVERGEAGRKAVYKGAEEHRKAAKGACWGAQEG